MQRFHFKLQKLLDYRKIREEQAEAEFAKATRVFLLEKDRLRQLETTLVETFDLLKAEQGKPSSLLMLKMFQDYCLWHMHRCLSSLPPLDTSPASCADVAPP